MEILAPDALKQQKSSRELSLANGSVPSLEEQRMPLPHRFPETMARSEAFRVTISSAAGTSGIDSALQLDVLYHIAAHHTSFETIGPVEVEIEILSPRKTSEISVAPFIRPLSRGIRGTMHSHDGTPGDSILRFTLSGPENLQIEIDGQPLLYIYALPPAPAAPTGPRVRRFEGGKIHDIGQLLLKEGEICWIDAGAVLRGSIRSERTAHVRVGGYGVLEGGYWLETENRRRKSLVLDHCRHARIESILMLSPCHWMLVLGGCADIAVHGVRQIAFDVSSDGIDICGSRRVHITGCCLHNGDDNIAIKAIHNRAGQDDRVPLGFPDEDWKGIVEDVLVENCTFYNIKGGSSMEIGYETSTDHIRNIRFHNIDVIAVHEFGSVFGIHNGDRACVDNVEWSDIRVEHHYDKLIDIRIVKSRWNLDADRGSIRNITLRNIKVIQSPYNVGYTLSVISGYDNQHPVTNVHVDNFELGGHMVHSADELDLVSRHLQGLKFSNGNG